MSLDRVFALQHFYAQFAQLLEQERRIYASLQASLPTVSRSSDPGISGLSQLPQDLLDEIARSVRRMSTARKEMLKQTQRLYKLGYRFNEDLRWIEDSALLAETFSIRRVPGRYPKLEDVLVERQPKHEILLNTWILEGGLEGEARWTEKEIQQVNAIVHLASALPNTPQFGVATYFFQKWWASGQFTFSAGRISLSNQGVSRSLDATTLETLLDQWLLTPPI